MIKLLLLTCLSFVINNLSFAQLGLDEDYNEKERLVKNQNKFHVVYKNFSNHVIQEDSLKFDVYKFYETSFEYKQLKNGYFSLTQSFYRKMPWTYDIASSEHNLSLGYSPWRNSFLIETNQRLNITVTSLGFGFGRAFSIEKNSASFYLKLELGIKLYVVWIYYSYSFLENKNFLYYKDKSSLSMTIPIFSSDGFLKFKGKKTYHWGAFENYKK